MSTATHAPQTKFFRVAMEGATTDGRTISRDWITQMAKNYSPTMYGARVNLEHFRGIDPAGLFKAYGDVLALEARDETGEFAGKLGLYAQLKPTDDLVALTKKGQKIYTSIEVDPSFADTKQAYMVGLAVTDNPASLGTQVLTFAAQNPAASPFAAKKLNPNTLFTSADEAVIELDEAAPSAPSVFKRVTELMNKFRKDKEATDEARFTDIGDAVDALATHCSNTDKAMQTMSGAMATILAGQETDRAQFAALKLQLSAEPNPHQSPRPAVLGNNEAAVTDC